MKANKTKKGEAVSNHKRRKDKESKSNIDSAAYSQTLKYKNNKMAGFTTYLSILTLNVNNLTPPSKHTFWQTGLKKKTRIGDPFH
jgi:hypothetical protein